MSQSEIAVINRQFEDAARKGDLDRLASLYTPDAVALPPDGPVVKGRDNIKQMWGSIAQQMGLKDVRLKTLDLELAGDVQTRVGVNTVASQSDWSCAQRASACAPKTIVAGVRPRTRQPWCGRSQL
jgi:uncharacterized protein (TIGR02246 family)